MKPWIAFAIIATTTALATTSLTRAQAEEPKATQTLTLDTSKLRQIYAGVELGTGTYGYELGTTLGAQDQELHILGDRKYVLQWSGSAEGVGGIRASTHPFNEFYGIRGAADGEAGIRLLPALKLSPYIGADLGASGHAVAIAGASSLTQTNNADGLAGLAGAAHARLNVGGSVLGASHLETVAFIQEEVLAKETNTPGKVFTDVGLHVKYDIKDRFVVSGDLWIGTTGENKDLALGTTTQTNRWGVALNATKTLGEHWLIGGTVALGREGNTTSSASSALVYTTAEPVDASFGIRVGYTP